MCLILEVLIDIELDTFSQVVQREVILTMWTTEVICNVIQHAVVLTLTLSQSSTDGLENSYS